MFRATSIYLSISCLWVLVSCAPKVVVPDSKIEPIKAPEFELKTIHGQEFSSQEVKGKMVVINFCTTWSPACSREVLELRALQEKWAKKKKPYQVIGVSIDENGKKDALPVFGEMNLNYPILVGSYEFAEKFGGIDVVPSTFIIEPDWTVVNRYTGQTDSEILEVEMKQRYKDFQKRQKELAKLQKN